MNIYRYNISDWPIHWFASTWF